MDVFQLSYLLRYVLVILILLLVGHLLSEAISELRWHMKNSVLPARGYFLMAAEQQTAVAGAGLSLPLYHTTCIGTSASSDIRIRSRLVSKRHAIIYFFDGDWFIRAASPKIPVYINHVRIEHSVPLENRDIIGIGDMSFVFINERETASEAMLRYESIPAAPQYPKEKSSPKLMGAFICVNLFTLAGAGLMLYFIPTGQDQALKIVAYAFLSFLVLSDLYYLILPLILKNLDRSLLLVLMQLTILGMLFQVRLDLVGISSDKTAVELLKNLYPQGLSLMIAFLMIPIVAFLAARTHLPEHLGMACAVATPLLLIVTLIFGNGADAHGATLWINISGMSLQLTAFAKTTYLIVLASFFKTQATRKNQLIFAGWAAFVFLLIMMLPDLGSAMILLPTTIIVYVVMTSEYLTTLAILLSGSAVSAIAFAVFPHVRRRILGWTTLWTEVNDSNRQIVYGLQAMARGGLFGRGLGNGSPGGIPLASSDMIYSIVCEELGLLTGLCIVILFIILWLRAAKTTIVSHDGYSSSLALGIGTLMFVEATIVISGTTGLFPLTGATLPLIARGGSSALTIVLLFAILLGLSARREKEDTYV